MIKVAESKFNLAAVRILFFVFVLLTMSSSNYFLSWINVPSEFWHPRGLLRFLDGPMSFEFVSISFHLWRWIGVLCIFGAYFRLLAPIWWILSLIVVTNAHSYGYQSHVFMPVILAGLPLCFSRASDTLSFDAWRRRAAPVVNESDYRVPLRTHQLVFCLVYFAAGVAKVRHGGWDWISGETLRNYLVRASWIYSDTNPLAHAVGLNEILSRRPLLCNFLAFGAVLLELSAPLALFRRKWSYVIVPLIALLQVSIFFTIYVRFTPYIVLIFPWINWWKICGYINRQTNRWISSARAYTN